MSWALLLSAIAMDVKLEKENVGISVRIIAAAVFSATVDFSRMNSPHGYAAAERGFASFLTSYESTRLANRQST
jgi:hypothetical protein